MRMKGVVGCVVLYPYTEPSGRALARGFGGNHAPSLPCPAVGRGLRPLVGCVVLSCAGGLGRAGALALNG